MKTLSWLCMVACLATLRCAGDGTDSNAAGFAGSVGAAGAAANGGTGGDVTGGTGGSTGGTDGGIGGSAGTGAGGTDGGIGDSAGAGAGDAGTAGSGAGGQAGAPGSGAFSVHNASGTILDPDGNPIALRGYRMQIGDIAKPGAVLSEADINYWKDRNLAGNTQAVEIWWTKDSSFNPGEPYPYRPGVYSTEGLDGLKTALRSLARTGMLIIPSIRVSYDQQKAREATRLGQTLGGGWADHVKVVENAPVVVEEGPHAGTYGKHGDRFFLWLDWLISSLLEDPEISDAIVYWEMWHYCGHRHGSFPVASQDKYLKNFLPALIAKYRQWEPTRLLGAGFVLDNFVNRGIAMIQAGTWAPYQDPNLLYVIAGYGSHCDLFNEPADHPVCNLSFPEESNNPKYLTGESRFNIQKFREVAGVTLHSQEGPGLINWWRRTPMQQTQRQWVAGMLNLYNDVSNGFGWHAWPPSWADKNESMGNFAKPPGGVYDETDTLDILETALRGDHVANP